MPAAVRGAIRPACFSWPTIHLAFNRNGMTPVYRLVGIWTVTWSVKSSNGTPFLHFSKKLANIRTFVMIFLISPG